MPIVVSFALILAFILPAFILYEPPDSDETVSFKLIAVVCLAACGISAAFFRLFASWWRTRRLIGEWSRNAIPIKVGDVSLSVFRLRHPFPVFAVVGVARPMLFIAEQVLTELDQSEIEAVLKHELGHIAAWDNLKRLAMKVCGDLLVAPVGRSLVENWSETAERAADEYAVEQGGRPTALSLASALIKIARLVPDEPLPAMPVASYVLSVDESLAIRVRRLLSLAEGGDVSTGFKGNFLIAFLGLGALMIGILAMSGGLLERVHNISEAVFAALQ